VVELSQFFGELAVANLVNKLPSKIVQIANSSGAYDAWALCEDGSVWCFDLNLRNWTEMHPPHKPPTQAADLAEALEILRRLTDALLPVTKDAAVLIQDARKILNKHGVPTK
jgi:hypothetical protein